MSRARPFAEPTSLTLPTKLVGSQQFPNLPRLTRSLPTGPKKKGGWEVLAFFTRTFTRLALIRSRNTLQTLTLKRFLRYCTCGSTERHSRSGILCASRCQGNIQTSRRRRDRFLSNCSPSSLCSPSRNCETEGGCTDNASNRVSSGTFESQRIL